MIGGIHKVRKNNYKNYIYIYYIIIITLRRHDHDLPIGEVMGLL